MSVGPAPAGQSVQHQQQEESTSSSSETAPSPPPPQDEGASETVTEPEDDETSAEEYDDADAASFDAGSVSLSVASDDDNDSALGADVVRPESSVSLTPSVFDFPEEFGRTWHKYKQGTYFLPNDSQEQDRLDLEHAITLKVFENRLNFAPVQHPHRVLDLGTGTGIWAIEFAEQNPGADILGTDLSPIQPQFVPSNCRFEVDDCEDEWIFSFPFDYIHLRYLSPYLKDIPKLMSSIYHNLNPGCWVEVHECILQFRCVDSSLDGTAVEKWNGYLRDGIRRLGRDVFAPFRIREYMLDAGFENVTQKKFVVPTSPWAKGRDEKLLGAMQMRSNLEGITAMSLWVFSKGLGWRRDEIETFLVDVKKDLTDRRIHSYMTLMAVWGQKPLAA